MRLIAHKIGMKGEVSELGGFKGDQPKAVIPLTGTTAQNADIYKYPIYNFLASRLFY